MGESCSAFMQASARGLAKLGAYMANNGAFGGKRLVSEESVQEMISEPTLKVAVNIGLITNMTKGGCALFNKEVGQELPLVGGMTKEMAQ